MASEWQQSAECSVGVQRRYLWVVEDIACQPALMPWVVDDAPEDSGDIVRVHGHPLAEIKRTSIPALPPALIRALHDRAAELHERVAEESDITSEFSKANFERLERRVALLEQFVAGDSGAGHDNGNGGHGGGGGGDHGGGSDDGGSHHTHRGPLYYADPVVFVRDLHATLQGLADEWWPNVTPDQVAERMPQPISKGTLANRLRENGMLENNSLTWTIKKLYAQHRRKLV